MVTLFHKSRRLYATFLLIGITFSLFHSEEAFARRGRRRLNNADFARLFLSFNPNVINTGSINPAFLGFNSFGIGNQFGRNAFFNNPFGFNNGFGGFNSAINPFGNAAFGAGGGVHLAGSGALDPSLLFVNNSINAGFGLNPFDPFNQFNQFGNQNFAGNNGRRRGLLGRMFGDTTPSSGFEPAAGGLCGKDSVEQICSGNAVQQKAETEQSVRAQLSQKVADSFDDAGATARDFNTFNYMMGQLNRGARFISQSAKNWYDNYLASFSKDLDLTDLVNQQKEALIEGLYAQGFSSDIAKAAATIRNAQVVFKPNLNDPTEMYHFMKTCGADNGVNNAFACPFHDHTGTNKIFVCGGRLLAAIKRGNGDMNLIKADLSHTIAHELGHMIGSEASSPFSGQMSTLAACYARSNGQPMTGEFNAEKTADWHAAWAIAKNIEKGQTQGLSPTEYLSRNMARLCGTQATADHPSGNERVTELMTVIRMNPVAREKLPGCPALLSGEVACTNGPTGGRSL